MIPADPTQCTYSGDPASSLLDAVRFYSQDTDSSFWILTDEEMQYLIDETVRTTNDNPIWIASRVCIAIAAKFTREVNVSADAVSVNVGDLQRKYLTLAQMLREAHDEEHGEMALPGPARPGDDLHIPPLLFGIGMSDNFEAGRQDYGYRRYPGAMPGPETMPELEQQ